MVVVRLNLSDEIMQKIDQIIQSGGYTEEKDVIVRAVRNLFEDTIGDESSKPTDHVEIEKNRSEIWLNTSHPLIKALPHQEKFPPESSETIIESPDILYGEKYSGLIFTFHNRFFVVKWIMHVLAKYIVEEDKKFVNMQEFRDMLEVTTKDFIKYFKESPNAEMLLVSFPSSKEKFEDMPRLKRIRGRKNKEDRAKQLEIVSMDRYLSQNFGRVLVKKEKRVTRLAGACFEFGFLRCKVINDEVFITLSEKGLKFVLLDNPILTQVEKYLKTRLKDTENIFSKEEQRFILKEIIANYPLEKNIVNKYLKKEILNVKEMTEIFLEEQRNHLGHEVDLSSSHLSNNPIQLKIRKRIYGRLRSTSIMRRLVEIGLFRRINYREDHNKSGKRMRVIEYERI